MKLYEAMAGFRFFENPRLVEGRQLRFPRSKRRRIRRKWAKRPGNMEWRPCPGVMYDDVNKVVIGHPDTILRLKARIAESARNACVSPNSLTV